MTITNLKSTHQLLVEELEKEISELEVHITDCVENAGDHQYNADCIGGFDKGAYDISIYWRNYYQQRERYFRQRLIGQQAKLEGLIV